MRVIELTEVTHLESAGARIVPVGSGAKAHKTPSLPFKLHLVLLRG